MKKFLTKCGIIIGVMVLFVLVIEFALARCPNNYTCKKDYMDKHLDEIKWLIIGQSHFEEGINPLLLRDDSIYNFAISGQNLFWTEQLAQRYIPRMKNLEVVFLPFQYGMGFKSKQKDNSSSFSCMYIKYMNLSKDALLDWYYSSEVFNSELAYIDRLKRGSDYGLQSLDSLKGYVPLPLAGKKDNWETGHLPHVFDYSERNEDFYKQTESILGLCQQRGIRIIMVAIPWWKSAHAEMTPEGIAKMQEVADELLAKYPCLEYHNYVFDKRFVADDFNDATHLNENGAPKFTKILKHDLGL